MPEGVTLIGDLGGTHARFALSAGRAGAYTDVLRYVCKEFASPEAAIEAYLDETDCGIPAAMCLAVAAPVRAQTARFLNSDWTVEGAALARRFGGARVRLYNDFHAVAHAIPALGNDDVKPVGPSRPELPDRGDFTVGVIGPGTGLGVSGLLRVAGSLRALDTEGGHCGFAPESERQIEILKALRRHHDRVSDERLLSGQGLRNIYGVLRAERDRKWIEPEAAEIFRLALEDGEDAAIEAVDLFWEILGQVAGNLALTLGARDGVYLAGGIARRYPDCAQRSPFRKGFENKGRHRELMEAIATGVIVHPEPGLVGAAVLAADESQA